MREEERRERERETERVGDEGKVAHEGEERRGEKSRREKTQVGEVESDCVRRRVVRGGSGCPRATPWVGVTGGAGW